MNKLIRKSGQIHGIKTVADEYRFGKNKDRFKVYKQPIKGLMNWPKGSHVAEAADRKQERSGAREKYLQSFGDANVYPTGNDR